MYCPLPIDEEQSNNVKESNERENVDERSR